MFLGLMSLCLPVLFAVPAIAQSEGGTGRLVGTEETQEMEADPPTTPPCLKVHEVTMALQGVGTYYGFTEAGERAVYRAQVAQGQELHDGGPLELLIDSEEHFIAPEGTYAERLSRSDGCDQDTYGEDGKIPATFTLHATNHVHEEDGACTGEGHWWRVHSTVFAEWAWESACTIEGNEPGFLGAGTVPPETEHRIEGNFDPCFYWDWPCDDNIRVSFTQMLPASAEAARVHQQAAGTQVGSGDDGADGTPHFAAASSHQQPTRGWWLLTAIGASLVAVTVSSRWQRKTYRRAQSGQLSE